VERLEPVIFNDAWGSHVSIASLMGRSIPSALPESELWMGAHEAGPSGLRDREGETLQGLIAADPQGTLGDRNIERFGSRLPFLLKVLAPGKAISIQAHPTSEQAQQLRSGDKARAAGADEVYVDDWAKPELLVAIAPFEVFVGLRDHAEIVTFIERLAVPRLTQLLTRTADAPDPVHALLAAVLATPEDDVRSLARELVAAAVRVEGVDDELGDAASAIVRIAEEHPDDIGLVVLALMHHRVLQPGEFIDVAAGVLHSYVRGLGIEVLANSDNVVRAGLTAKPVNVPELLRIVDTAADGVAGRPREVGPGVEVFDSASDRFVLHRLSAGVGPLALPGEGARIVFSLRGGATVACAAHQVELGPAESAFVRADDSDAQLVSGEAYVVAAP